jgi:hypothetical protein
MGIRIRSERNGVWSWKLEIGNPGWDWTGLGFLNMLDILILSIMYIWGPLLVTARRYFC